MSLKFYHKQESSSYEILFEILNLAPVQELSVLRLHYQESEFF